MEEMTDINTIENFQVLWEKLITSGVDLGKRLLAAIVIYLIGRIIKHIVHRMLERNAKRKTMDPEVQSFMNSAIRIGLNILIIIAVVGALGIETSSFAALLASAGVAIGMALSGQMQNLAGGILILIQRPYRIGDYIITHGIEGTVSAIQIFSTKLHTPDNREVTVPNGTISSEVLINVTAQKTRRIDFSFGVEYNTDIDKVREILQRIADQDKDILQVPKPLIAVEALADSSVNVKLRVWVETENYWNVTFRIKETVYKTFNEEGVSFPFPQLTVHQA